MPMLLLLAAMTLTPSPTPTMAADALGWPLHDARMAPNAQEWFNPTTKMFTCETVDKNGVPHFAPGMCPRGKK